MLFWSVVQCGGTTHVLRLSWSPDGAYVVSAHAMNNRGPTAQIIDRDGWKANMDFVGHRKAVTCVVSHVCHYSKIPPSSPLVTSGFLWYVYNQLYLNFKAWNCGCLYQQYLLLGRMQIGHWATGNLGGQVS